MTISSKTVLCSLVGAMLVVAPAQAKSKGAIDRQEDKLSAAGFEPHPATTPAAQAMLARLPAYKFTRRVNGDTTAYVYADPKDCNCVYVGDQAAYATYQRQQQAQNLADERQETAMDYQDADWDWGAWGPWGPRWGRFGFGVRHGW